MSICCWCKMAKPLSDYYVSSRTICRSCKLGYAKAYALKYPDKARGYKRAYVDRDPERHRLRNRAWNKANPDKIKVNRPKVNAHQRRRTTEDIHFRLSKNLRGRLCAAVRKSYKSGSAVADLGCSIEDFKSYIETKFVPGMSWGNWGRKGWHLDHIVPLTSFDLTNRQQFLAAAHYTNLQPLWASENITKGHRLVYA